MLIKEIEKAFKNAAPDAGEVLIERPEKAEFGDYTSNIAFGLKGESPKEAAEKIAKQIAKSKIIEKAEAKGGFVNVFLKKEVWVEELKEILQDRQDYGLLTLGKEKTVNVEFISANPTGEIHVGNGRGVFFGDVLSNVLEKAGYNVKREYLVNNAKVSVQINELGKTVLGKGESYKTEYLENIIEELKPEIDKLEQDNFAEAGFLAAERIIKDVKRLVEEKMKVRVDRWFSENEMFESGQVDAVLSKIETYEKDGAVWAKTTKYGDDEDRVLVRSNKTPGYFLSDIAYHLNKAARSDIMIDIWGADHQGHVKRIMAVAEEIGFRDKVQILITQIVHIKEKGKDKKMSKRKGDTVNLEWLIDEVGLDAARFFYLSKSLNTHMDFDVALAREQSQNNPVFYVQYSFARSHQILKKVEVLPDFDSVDVSLLDDEGELSLIKKLAEYPEIIERIVRGYEKSESYDLHKLTMYATDLSAIFHKFYETSKVLVDDEKLRDARLALVRAYQIVLGDVLRVLGVSAPEKM